MLRKIIAVLIGYIIFATSALALFNLTGQKPHAGAPVGFKITTAVYGAIFSFLSGWVLQLVARTKNLTLNLVLAFIMAAFAAISMFTSNGSNWTQMFAILIFAPVSVAGGMVYLKKHQPKNRL